MSLSAFIREHHEEIISEFAVFAKTLMPSGAEMTEAELRDHAEEILTAVVEDISTPQTPQEQSLKSRGRGSANVMEATGKAARRRSHSARIHFSVGARGVSRTPGDRAATV